MRTQRAQKASDPKSELLALKKRYHLTTKQIADAIDVKPRRMRAWEQGQNPTPKWVLTLLEVAEAEGRLAVAGGESLMQKRA